MHTKLTYTRCLRETSSFILRFNLSLLEKAPVMIISVWYFTFTIWLLLM